jgi:hypothetical protein
MEWMINGLTDATLFVWQREEGLFNYKEGLLIN